MTGNAFLKRLRFQLDFLSIEDQEVVLSFYQNKIQSAETLTHEEEIVRSFGSPEFIAEKLKKIYFKHLRELKEENNLKKAESSDVDESKDNAADDNNVDTITGEENHVSSEANTVDKEADISSEDQIKDDSDVENVSLAETETEVSADNFSNTTQNENLIFSRSESQEHCSEVIHTIEHDDVVPIYGEKVVLETKETSSDESDSMDQENGFTPEEIEAAKKETLQKAKNYSTETFSPIKNGERIPLDLEESENQSFQSEIVPISENLQNDLEDNEEDPVEYIGLFNKPFYEKHVSKAATTFAKCIFTILCAPILLPTILFLTTIFAVIVAFCFVTIAALFLIDLVAIIGGCIELAYGFTLIFQSVSVALIEIGIGTALFGLVVAFSALIYEFLTVIMPKLLRKLTKKFKGFMRKFICIFYGGKA